MPGPRSYTTGTTTALISLARDTCYYPSCPVPIFIFVDGKPQANYTVAHIRAAKPNGPRYVKDMSDDARRDFPNLILLCLGHHNAIDGRGRDKYTIEVLEEWKSKREAAGRAELKGLREVTEDRLQEMLTGALEAQVQRLEEAIDRLGRSDPDAARTLRGLAAGLNPDIAEMLYLATRDLKPALNPDTVEMLYLATRVLKPVLNPDTVGTLSSAASQLGGAADVLQVLNNELSRRINELRRLQDGM
jgi:hypothetical protein